MLRSDNGPEFISEAMADWAGTRTGLSYIPPGSPWRNGYVESFNSRLRDECLGINSYYSLLHAQVVIGGWKDEYNHHRRHSSLGYLPQSSTLGSAPIKWKPTTHRASGPNEGGGPLVVDGVEPGRSPSARPASFPVRLLVARLRDHGADAAVTQVTADRS
ncbi:hypothetical protein JOF34_001641 [Microbacterium amylolyticum]|uniref:Integrase catalytic domain-containing protein n=1 Tax=Microbacterium amylolyticum TaxID=936337 RepID=A0ABS4ZJC7_9MICO|nr:hypothetical protein [Microbacterium amylolyticum]